MTVPDRIRSGTGLLLHLALVIALSLAACCLTGAQGAAAEGASVAAYITAPPEPAKVGINWNPAGQDLATDATDIEFTRLSLEEGLSQSLVVDIVQDDLGFIWLATGEGLDRFDGYEFRHYQHDPQDPGSLGTGTVSQLYLDRASRMWIRKIPGSLDRYDAATGRFVHYELAGGIEDEGSGTDFVWTIYEDRGGMLWAGTYLSGLFRYDEDADQFVAYRHDPQDPYSLSDNRVYAIYEDSDGVIWAGTRGGLNRLDRNTGRFTSYVHNPEDARSLGSDIVQQVWQDSAGRLWVTTYGVGLEQVDRNSGQVVTRYEHDPADPTTIDRTDAIPEVYQDRQGYVWIIHFDGRLDRLDPETGTFRRLRHQPDGPSSIAHDTVTFIDEDRAGNLWVGTLAGLDRYEPDTGGFRHYRHDPRDPTSLSGNSLTCFFEDRAGVLWFGTDGRGASLYAPHRDKFRHIEIAPESPDSEPNNYVQAILQDRAGNLWLGTNAGLNRYEATSGALTRFRHDPQDVQSLGQGEVWSIHEDTQGTLWIGLATGLDRYDGATETFVHYGTGPEVYPTLGIGTVRSITQGGAGELWLARYRLGLCRFSVATGECTYYVPDPGNELSYRNRITAVYPDDARHLWIATSGGLLYFDSETEAFSVYQQEPGTAHSLGNNAVLSLYRDRSGRLWVGTAGGGLDQFDPEIDGFLHYTEEDGLVDDTVVGILEGEPGILWLSTRAGLSRFDPAAGVFKNYDVGDGLQSSEFLQGSAYKGQDGLMYFGGINGFNAFRPEQIQDNPYPPPIVLTSLTQGGWPVEVDLPPEGLTEVSIRWPNNFIEFEFAALDYTDPATNRYAYLLEGFRDEVWNYVGTRRFGKYTNLPGGTYTLRLRGSNNDGVWNEEGVAIRLRVVPPFWSTWWFRGMLATAALGGVGVGYRRRVRNVERRSRELESLVGERTHALATRTRELQLRTQEIEERKQELEALYRADAELHRHLGLEEVLQALVDITVDILGADKSSLFSWDPRRQKLAVRVARGYRPDTLAEMVYARGEGTVGQAASQGEIVVVEDTRSDPRISKRGTIVEPESIRSYVQVPVQVGGEVLFVYSADYMRQKTFGAEEKRILQSLAQRAALAIENAQLYEQTQEAAAGQERSRLARELHDAVTQTLFSASLIAEALPELWETDPEEGAQLLRELRQLSRGAMAEMRTLLLELRPAALVETSLSELLRQLGDAAAGRTGMRVRVAAAGRCGLPPEVHVALYRIAQEALNNVVKHSSASQVRVSLECDPLSGASAGAGQQRVRLEVVDNGSGFSPGIVRHDRLGLGIIRERAQAIGAEIKIESEPGHGTHLTVVWEGEP